MILRFLNGLVRKRVVTLLTVGVALYKGMVYVGSLDGRLIAIDAALGEAVWEIVTVDQTQAYTITGAPRVVDGKGDHWQQAVQSMEYAVM